MKLTKFFCFMFIFWCAIPVIAQEEEEEDLMDMSLEELLDIKLDYGYEDAPVSIHAYMNTALWNFGEQFWGRYANVGGSAAGRPLFISYSGYISISAKITSKLFAEVEFELYKGQKGEFKVTRLRQVWTPSQYFRLTLGRDFPAIGVQDKIYYPTSQFRLMTIAPYTYLSILRATGWWDSGVHMSGMIPFGSMKLMIDMSIINGPGDQHQSADYLLNHMKPNVQGYMYETFHDKARQPWDNNKSKHIATRLSFSPIKKLLFGGSYMFGKYDINDKYNADFVYAHLLYGGERLTIAAEYGQLAVDVNPTFYTAGDTTAAGSPKWDNTLSGTLNADKVTQYSYYISAGYKFFTHSSIEYFEPVFRYEFMDSWKEDKQDKGDRNLIWLGFRFSPIKHWVIKAAHSIQTESYKDLENGGFVIESVIDF